MSANVKDATVDHALGEEYEHEAVPLARRKPLSPRSGSASR